MQKSFSKTRNTRKTPNDVQTYGSAVRTIESLTQDLARYEIEI